MLLHQAHQAQAVVGGLVTSTKNVYVASLVVMWLMMIGIVAGIAFLCSAGTAILMTPLDRSEPTRLLLPYVGIKAVVSIFWILHITLYCVWKRRSMRNAWILAADAGRKPSISPGWSIGFYFIPIMMWFMPFKAMKEIWQTSVPERRLGLLSLWWGSWILYQITEQTINIVEPISSYAMVISDVLLLISGIALTRIMSVVTKAQREKANSLAS